MNNSPVRPLGALLAGCACVAAAHDRLPRPAATAQSHIAKGVVGLNGTPLKGGSVHFELAGKDVRQTDAIINDDGSYIADNVPVGEVLIGVETESLKHGGPPESYVKIPLRYNDAKTSTLKHSIVLGDNKVPIDLTDK